MENLNIALIGCGMIGREHIERIQNRIRGAQVVAVCDVFEEGAKKGAEIAGAGTKVYTDFNEAINDPDVNAVVVTTPGQFHKGPVLAAIKAGKPVFSEKPLANTAADGKEIVEAEMAGGKHLVQVGFMRRYDRGYRQVTKNNYNVVWEKADGTVGTGMFNGDVGRIVEIDPSGELLVVNFDDRIATYTLDMLNEIDLAYAMTVHKALLSFISQTLLFKWTAIRQSILRLLQKYCAKKIRFRKLLPQNFISLTVTES